MPVTPLLSPTENMHTSPGFVSPPPAGSVTPLPSGTPPRATTPGFVSPPGPTPTQGGILQTPAPAAATGYNPTTYNATPYTSKGYEASPYAVQKDGLVQNRVLDLVGNDSPLMQQARTKAMQTMNARGLLNSSLAVQAGQEGVLSKALEIANPDAAAVNNAMFKTGDAENASRQFNSAAENAALTNTANQQNAASQFNAAAGNTAGQFNAGAVNTASQANLQAQNQAFITSLNNAAQLSNTKLTTETQMALGQLDATTKIALTNLDNQNRQLLQGNVSASSAYVQAVQNIASISQSNTMSQEAKDAAISTQINLLRQQLQVVGGIASTAPAAVQNLNLGQYFQVGGGTAFGGETSFSNLPLRTDVPNGGHRDQRGNVYNADGSPAGWRGPEGANTYLGPTGTIYTDVQQWATEKNSAPTPPTGNTVAPATSRPGAPAPTGTAPTGTVTNPAQTSGPRKLTGAEQLNRAVIPWPGARWDNRYGWRV